MRRGLVGLVCAVALLSAAASGHNSIGWNAPTPKAQKKAVAARFAPFVGTLEEARKEAAERNVPLVVFAVLVEEEASERFAKTLPADPAVATALDGTVLVIANAGEHPARKLEETVDGKKTSRDVCSVFLTPTCADHQRNWDPVFFAFNEDGALRCPQVMLVAPDGKVSRRLMPGDVPKPSQIASAVAGVREKLGAGLSREELDTVKAAQAAARKAIERDDHPEAWRAWSAVIAVNPATKYAEEARAGAAQALAGIATERDAALELVKGDQVLVGYAQLVSLAERCKGLPNEKELAKAVAQAESLPTKRDVIAAYKKGLAAEALWKEFEELSAANQKRKAETKLRLLIRKYWDTEAGKRARKAYPEIAADEDSKGG
ncbi:MAG: hypothetical protein IT453_05745 [Planctomycetes bacterium]|nr:hypothetical protein [Planctomycetota bacterium]